MNALHALHKLGQSVWYDNIRRALLTGGELARYELLQATDPDVDVAAAVGVWRHGSVVRSWLLDLLADAVAEDPTLGSVRGWVEDSGEGRWTVQEAVDLAVPTPAIAAALFARFASRQEDSPARRALATLRQRFGGHATRS